MLTWSLWLPLPVSGRCSSRRLSRAGKTFSWKSRWRSIRAGSARSRPRRTWPTQKGLAIVAGTQRRHQTRYLNIMKRIHEGAIGELVGGQCYWNQGDLWVKQREAGMSEIEWQCRNWLYFTWLSGDHIVQQHVHNIDVVNWAFQALPVKVM